MCITLLNWGFKISDIDRRLFFVQSGTEFIIILVVVDDMKFVSNSSSLMTDMNTRLSTKFNIKFFGRLQTFIGWEISHCENGITVTQNRYAKDILEKCGLNHCNAVWTPLPTEADLTSAHTTDIMLTPFSHSDYLSVVGALIYLAVCTRLDLSFAVSVLARQVHAPIARHQILLKRVLGYVAGTSKLGLHFRRGHVTPESLEAHVDANWGDVERLDIRQQDILYR